MMGLRSLCAWLGTASLGLVGCSSLLDYNAVAFGDAGGDQSSTGGAGGGPGSGGASGKADGGGVGLSGAAGKAGNGSAGGPLTDGCVATSCKAMGAECGAVDDGCGSKLDCGTCQAPNTCGGGGTPNQCGCAKTTCAAAGAECGSVSDNCAGQLDCSACPQPNAVCTSNKCVCTPTSCAAAGYDCGSLADGCGTSLACGSCQNGSICGGGGVANKCAAPTGHYETKTDPGATGSEPGGLVPVCCVPSTQEKQYITEVFNLVNQHRQANNVGPLTYDDKLEAAIEGHCHHMATHDFFSHSAPESSISAFTARASLCGTSASGENIAAGQGSPADVMSSWKNSPGHNANMLNGGFSRIGIGFYAGGPWGTYWGQIFGN